jgi:hypothetical protein
MKAKRQRPILAVFLAVFASLGAGSVRAQSFGTLDQSTVVGAAAFTGETQPGSLLDDGYLHIAGGPYRFVATLALPDGAQITQLCLYATNFKPGATLQLELQAVKLAPGGLSPGVVAIPGTQMTADGSSGADFVCSSSIAYTFHDDADVDGDGTPEHVGHRLAATFSPDSDGSLGLGGVRVVWHRQISPAPGSPTFGDVPPDSIFFQHVEALAASTITGGCGNSDYCPNAPLTRGQMAVFLSKALGLHWPL